MAETEGKTEEEKRAGSVNSLDMEKVFKDFDPR